LKEAFSKEGNFKLDLDLLNETPRETNNNEVIITSENIQSGRKGESLIEFSHKESINIAKDDLLGWDL
jgi:hypothetical protein